MAFKLAVSQKVRVPMSFTLADDGKPKKFSFSLLLERIEEQDWQGRIKDANGVVKNELVKQALIDLTVGWEGQNLVLDDDGQPAPFCPEALAVMFETSGVSEVALNSYLKEVAARGKN